MWGPYRLGGPRASARPCCPRRPFRVVASLARPILPAALLLSACGQATQSTPEPETAQVDATAPGPPVAPAAEAAQTAPATEAGTQGPCLVQDGEPVPANAIRGLGTEPFWNVVVEGRCVTYLTPEDQDGTRVWTKFSGTAENGRWAGALDGQPFVMETRPDPQCSDGMSDNIFPIAVTLTVRGEQRIGCARPH